MRSRRSLPPFKTSWTNPIPIPANCKTSAIRPKGSPRILQSRLQQAEGRIAKLQPLAEKAQEMPVTTSFAKASWGHGLTLQIKNLNPAPLKVNIAVNGSPKQSGTIKSGETLEVEKLTGGQSAGHCQRRL